jgi:hypothetical protein
VFQSPTLFAPRPQHIAAKREIPWWTA